MKENFFKKKNLIIIAGVIVFVAFCAGIVFYNSNEQKMNRIENGITQIVEKYTDDNCANALHFDVWDFFNNKIDGRLDSNENEELSTILCTIAQTLINEKEKIKFCEFVMGLESAGYFNQNVYDYIFNAILDLELLERIEWMNYFDEDMYRYDEEKIYSINNITRAEIEDYLSKNIEKISTSNIYGGYYSKEKEGKSSGNAGLSVENRRTFGDFMVLTEKGEFLDEYYAIHEFSDFDLYFRGYNITDLTQNLEDLKIMRYAPPFLVWGTESTKLKVYYLSETDSSHYSRLITKIN